MVALSEAYKDHNPQKLHQIVPLDFTAAGKSSVPASHDWTGLSSAAGIFHSVAGDYPPTVDLSDPMAPSLMARACEDWGAFFLTGHGVSNEDLAAAEAETRRLFGLPARRKVRALRSPEGATGYGTARITPYFPKHMWHEGFTIMGSPKNHAKQLWPVRNYSKNTTTTTSYCHRFCEVMEEYQKQMKNLSEKILTLLLNSLNTSPNQLDWLNPNRAHGNAPCTALQLNSYPKCPDPHRAVGLAQHTDTFLLTVVHQTHGGELQLLRGGAWAPVPAREGSVVVNVGDLLHVLSNGRFRSVVHRVSVNPVRHRYSFAYFYGPPLHAGVSPVIGSGESPVYRSVTVKEYVDIKAKCLDNALSLIRI